MYVGPKCIFRYTLGLLATVACTTQFGIAVRLSKAKGQYYFFYGRPTTRFEKFNLTIASVINENA